MAAKTARYPGFAQVQDAVRSLQDEGEKLLARVRKEAGKFVSKDQRKAIEGLLSQAKAVRTDIQKRTEKAIKTLETRAEKTLSRIEAEARKRIEPIVRRLSLPSKHDLELLAKRLSALEKKVEDLASSKAHAA
jgi:polyhydroxyalkanoate synthesis regulator phasin